MSILDTLRIAFLAVTSNKLRAALTMLGLIIGVASVIAMLALGNGAQAAVNSNFKNLGANDIQVNAAQELKNGKNQLVGKILSYQDGLNLPAAVPLVDKVDMSISTYATLRKGRASLDINVTGATADALGNVISGGQVQPVGWPNGKALAPDDFLAMGRFFTANEVTDAIDVCVLGSKTALELFAGDNPIGQYILVDRQRCQVIGVLAELESTDASLRYTTNPNETFIMPISSTINLLYKDPPSVNIIAHVTDASQMNAAEAEIAAYLRQRHAIEKDASGKYQDDFILTTLKDILGAQQSAAQTFALLLAAMAVVSLVVGGIGIMNVMLVSVTERTREIGVRMAIGATPLDIIAQFLCEATFISLAGGLIGVAVGIFVIPLAASFNQGLALLEPGSIPLAFGVALLTGILFGLYPALRASQLDPIEALRYV